jgi:hypothetical protein
VDERGLNDDGTIVREGALDRVPTAFGPVVDAARARIAEAFGAAGHGEKRRARRPLASDRGPDHPFGFASTRSSTGLTPAVPFLRRHSSPPKYQSAARPRP